MREQKKRTVVGGLALLGGVVIAAWSVMLGSAEAVTPYGSIALPATDGGIIICPPPQFAAVKVAGSDRDQRTALIQVREGEGSIRLGPSTVKGNTNTKNGIQLKARETAEWDVSTGNAAYCIAEPNSDAGVIVDVVFGVGGPR